MLKRTLGRSGIEISAMGLGCWAIGGPVKQDGQSIGWGQVDDAESLRALEAGIDNGINFLDTADIYGHGHSEQVVAKVLKGRREKIILATKFGLFFDEQAREKFKENCDPDFIRYACEASLKRLDTDYIDLYQFHDGISEAGLTVRDVLEQLVAEGKIRCYGWSTDAPEYARIFAPGKHCASIQFGLNVIADDPESLAVCDEFDLAAINKNPLNKGLLTGKYDADSTFGADDIRHNWDLKKGEQTEWLKKLNAIRDILCSDGKTPAQGALCWVWARSDRTIPIPGFKTVAQVEENTKAMSFGPLKPEQMKQIEEILVNMEKPNPA